MAKLCVALDISYSEAVKLLETLRGYPLIFKVGIKLLLQAGREIIDLIKKKEGEVFLDLKLHDIPNTVKLAVEEARDMGVDFLTVHTLGGEEMLHYAVSSKGSLKLLGVTLLTSHGKEYLNFLKASFGSVEEAVLYLANKAKERGLDGVVCSAWEARQIKDETGLLTVVPGIRYSASWEDQKRVCTPSEAVARGADILVMGRDIYTSSDPRKVVEDVLRQIQD